ncbi:MAG: DUF1592 domain-containing protein [Deltaproteobacteria bacterium]|nr:DUF1592 domain-containing protein [Deltaproteobacteria bacterium]
MEARHVTQLRAPTDRWARRAITTLIAAPLALTAVACTGELDAGPITAGAACATPDVPLEPIGRLTRVEYDYTVRDLLHVGTSPAPGFAADDGTTGFEVGGTVSPLLAEQYVDAALALGERAADDPAAVDAALGRCPTSGSEAEACVEDFLERFTRLAFRAPTDRVEIDALMALYREGVAIEGHRGGLTAAIAGVLSSPRFLYHRESEPALDAGAVGALDGTTVASRLSYFFWRSMPDEALLDDAEEGMLDEPEGIESAARRMIEDPRFERGTHDFVRQWLGLDGLSRLTKDDAIVPGWQTELRASLRTSMDAFVDHVMTEEEGSFEALMTSNVVFADEALAGALGETFTSPDPETGLARLTLPASERAGLLTQPALMALLAKPNQSDPIHRGVFVRTRVLCDVLEAPPADVDLTPPDLAPGLTTRQRFDMHRTEPRCAACHTLIDPIGYGFEHYDAMGVFRTHEGELSIDARGEVFDGEDANGAFDGAVELSERLAQSRVAQRCMARQVFRFAVGRIEQNRDTCSTRVLDHAFSRSDLDLRELMIAIVRTDAFRMRRVQEHDPVTGSEP